MKPGNPTDGRPTASRSYRELRRFFTGLPHELPTDPDALVALCGQHASPHLLGAGFDPRAEISMYLLMSFFMDTGEAQDSPWLRCLMATAPQQSQWRAYLSRFPPGDDCAGFRAQRLQTLDVLLVKAHPDRDSKMSYALAPDRMLPEIRRFISEHIQGPYVCTRCHREVEALRLSAGQESELSSLAAAGAEDLELAIELEAGGGSDALLVRCFDDRGYLRVFLHPLKAEPSMPANDCFIAIDFDDGYRLAFRMHLPFDAYAGCNAGHLGNRTMGSVCGILIVAEPPTR
jgi:hypothetical protein